MHDRIRELEEVESKIRAEKQMLRQTGDAGLTKPAYEQGQTLREKTPEEIIESLFTYHPVTDEAQQLRYGMVRDAAKALALQIWKACPYGADRTDAIRKLRECVMTANAAIALNGLSLR